MPTTDDYARIANVQPYGLPGFVQAYFGTEYPAGRGLEPQPRIGWQCPSCSRCWSPDVQSCSCVDMQPSLAAPPPEITDFDPDGT